MFKQEADSERNEALDFLSEIIIPFCATNTVFTARALGLIVGIFYKE